MFTNNYSKYFAAVLLVLGIIFSAHAEKKSSTKSLWKDTDATSVFRMAEPSYLPNKYRALSLDFDAMKEKLFAASAINKNSEVVYLELPLPDGQYGQFKIIETPMMEDELAAKYPEIKTYTGINTNDPSVIAKIDIGYLGFHAMIMDKYDRVFIDPVNVRTKENYISYNRSDAKRTGTFSCNAVEDDEFMQETEARLKNYNRSANVPVQLRTYRLALACTGEYAATKGGTKAGALSGMVTSMHRVNGVYEAEVAVTMVLVAKNDTLIFTDAASDPYSNNDGGTMLGQNHATCNSRIGSSSYDIGHVFSTGGGGIASFGCVCVSNRKGQGVTGSNSPVGDAFDIDYVAHEMGHQFGGSHTFNSQTGSCGGGNRSAATAFEPGSGITIMAYAGICGSDDLDAHSIPFFHAGSLDQINSFITTSSGNTCAVKTATGNNPPVVNAGNDFTIPANTSFILTGSATDPDGDGLTYSWDEMDLGPAGSVNSPTGDAPIFRTFSPVESPSRMFPKLSDVLANTQTKGERKPTTTRTMNFRLTARDNRFMAGATGEDEMQVNVTATAGPFTITSQNTAQTWTAGDSVTITWDVANTTAAPVNCANVNILLSINGGSSFPVILASNVANSGSQKVLVPSYATSLGRIKVEAAGNIFFDINNSNITINAATTGFNMIISSNTHMVCENDTVTSAIAISGLNGFVDPVTLSASDLPVGAMASFTDNPAIPGISAPTVSILTAGLAPGSYTAKINANSGAFNRTFTLVFTVSDTLDEAVELLFPYNGIRMHITSPTFSWNKVNGATGYNFQISDDATFATFIENTNVSGTSYTVASALAQNDTFYWRVAATNVCNSAPFSGIREFVTNSIPNVPTNLTIDSVTTNTAYISWTDNSDNEILFRLERSLNGTSFTSIAVLNANVTSYINTGLNQNTKYHYRVRATSEMGNSNYSNVDTATTKQLVGISRNLFEGELNVFPNPSDAQYNIELSGKEIGDVHVIICDELGRIIKEMNFEKNQDRLDFSLDLDEEAKGIYFMKIRIADSQIVERLIKY